ncbi:MAG TPA: hypothetical protein DDW50_11230 [Firmicutes bacterium]|jgi:hypothetical protein|nr:hypothetical protein [Bacillota bacterium]
MTKTNRCREVKESFSIGIRNEKSLHAAMKEWYALPGDQFEVKVDNFFIDILRTFPDGEAPLLIEIQTGNFTAIRHKLLDLLPKYQVRLVYPIPQEKWILRITPEGEIKSRRKSPKTGTAMDIFRELVRIPGLIADANFTIEVVLTREEHIWCEDGKGSWRRGGVSIKDRRLLEVVERIPLFTKNDFQRFLPLEIKNPFSNKDLAACGYTLYQARKMTYCFRKMGIIKEAGKHRNELLFVRN